MIHMIRKSHNTRPATSTAKVMQTSETAPSRPEHELAELMAEMPDGLPRVEGWDEMPTVGLEND